MDADGVVAMSGHGVIAVATLALERALVVPRDPSRLVLDTPAGTVRVAAARRADGSVGEVTFTNVPSFVVQPGVDVPLPGRRLRADVAFGGEFYAIVDAESAGVVVDTTRTGDLRRMGIAIAAAVDAALAVAHPVLPELTVLAGTVFTAPPQEAGADLRCATVRVSGAVDRSAGGTGTSAIMAVLDAMGLLSEEGRFEPEGLAGQRLRGHLRSRTQVGAVDAIVPEISGTAYVTGEHLFLVDAADPLAGGVRIS
jgi:proline racemase